MVTIREITGKSDPATDRTIAQIQSILRVSLPGLRPAEIESIPTRVKSRRYSIFETRLFVAESPEGICLGFALLLYCPTVGFCFLDYIATNPAVRSTGIGSLLYEHTRAEARKYGSLGLFFECSPDEPDECSSPELLAENASRLRFYERWGARPIINNQYTLEISPGEKDLPYLVYDALGPSPTVSTQQIRSVVKAILVPKYSYLCSPEYIESVVESFSDRQINLRPFRYGILASCA